MAEIIHWFFIWLKMAEKVTITLNVFQKGWGFSLKTSCSPCIFILKLLNSWENFVSDIYLLWIETEQGESILQVPDTGTQVLDKTWQFLPSSIVSF